MAECKHTGDTTTVAEISTADDKQFICNICIEHYNNPRYLPRCGHTFCENCLLKYTRNIQLEGQGSKFDCPVCRKSNDLPGNEEVTREWIQTFPLNTVIIKMMEALPRLNEKTKDKQRMCDPCKEEGETTVGFKFCLDCNEVLCKTCTKCHKNFKMSKGHALIEVAEISAKTGRGDFFQGVGKCAEHPERDVEFYCKSHDAVICPTCSIFQHKSCDLTEIAGYVNDDTELQKDSEMLVKIIKAAIEHINLLQKLRMENKNNIKEKLKEIREQIEQVRNQVHELMDNIVGHISDFSKQIEIENEDAHDAEISKVAKIKEEMEQDVALLDTISQHGSEKHKFVSVNLAKKKFGESDKLISEEDKCLKQLDVQLVIGDDLKKLVESTDMAKLAQIKVTESKSDHTTLSIVLTLIRDTDVASNMLKDSTLVKAAEYLVKSTDKNFRPQFCGVSVSKDGRILLCDYSEVAYMYLCNTAKNNQLKLMLDGPYCAVQIDDTHLAVSTGADKTISIVTIGDNLGIEKTFRTELWPLTIIALNNGQVAVGWGSPAAFGLIDISGAEIVQKLYIKEDTSGRQLKSCKFIAVDERRQHVIQPCSTDKAVYCFDFKGNPVFKYTHPELTDPRGVALDNCGNIYVCEYNTPGSIHKLSPTGEPISVITEGVPPCPRAICSDVTGTGFWVTRYSPPYDIVTYFRLEQNKNV